MGEDPSKRNQNLYCTYHKDRGHTTEQCRVLKDHLEQLAKSRYLKEFVMDPKNQEAGQVHNRKVTLSRPIGSDRSHPCSTERHPRFNEGCTDYIIGRE